MTVILIGNTDHREFELLSEAIQNRGEDALLWDTTRWPSDVPVTFAPGGDTVTVDETISRDEVTGVFAWPHQMFHPFHSRFTDHFDEDGVEQTQAMLDSWRGTFNALIQVFDDGGASVFFPPRTQHYHETKPLQLAQFHQAGVAVPDTVVTTDPDRAREFVATHGTVVYKPLVAAAAPHRLSEDELSEAPLERLSNAPVQFQEYVPGDDVRVYFLDGSIIGASRYVTDEWSFKSSPDAVEGAERVDLRAEVREDIKRAATASPLRFGAADIRLDADTHALLEVNPYPRFAFHDEHGTTEVTDQLATRLVG